MTKEKLKKEAEKNIFNLKNNAIKVSGKPFQITEGDYIQGYLDGAESREKRIEELEKNLKLWIDTKDARETIFFQQKQKIAELKEENKKIFNDWLEACDKYGKVNLNLTKAIELLKWALHSDPEHDNIVDFDTKWKEAEEFIKEIEK